jgi:hypothetical protein
LKFLFHIYDLRIYELADLRIVLVTNDQ